MKKKITVIYLIVIFIIMVCCTTGFVLYKKIKLFKIIKIKKDITLLRKILKRQLNGILKHNIPDVLYQKNLRREMGMVNTIIHGF